MKNICDNCLGCNLLPYIRVRTECPNFVKANETGIDKCFAILKGEQIKINEKGKEEKK